LRETLRQWLLQAHLWRSRQQRHAAVHQPRYRRDCLGELIQIDGSDHHWFEERGPACTAYSSAMPRSSETFLHQLPGRELNDKLLNTVVDY
jgi:hypothetical protein